MAWNMKLRTRIVTWFLFLSSLFGLIFSLPHFSIDILSIATLIGCYDMLRKRPIGWTTVTTVTVISLLLVIVFFILMSIHVFTPTLQFLGRVIHYNTKWQYAILAGFTLLDVVILFVLLTDRPPSTKKSDIAEGDKA